ncbi:alkaline phosphatase D family protein [Dankookia sp. P2]|uniref:alkaline phosphatase D family protein n=1 Tax=Dankookia sp. P2 TaxID=3423955 RepID=UPI003D670F0E
MDSTARHILDLHRRGLLRGALGLTALVVAQPAGAQPVFGRYPFRLGVASGDPWPDGMVLWTRLAPDPLAPLGGMPVAAVPVGWEVAGDDRFASIAARGTTWARPELGFSVHVEVAGLQPGRPYWYRFRAGAEVSPTGRTRTAPAPDAAPARLRFLNAGCQHLEHGWFTAWRHAASEEDIDFVFHYGDYIYETRGRVPGQPGWGPPQPVRTHAGEEVQTLEDYRRRYAEYHLDPDLAAAHAAHPFVCSFDDHEVDNNWAGAVSEEDGLSARHPVLVPPEVFALRKAAAFQAWYEAMPVRAALLPRGPEITAYRRLRYGRLLDLHVLDTRSFRDDQPCGDVTGPPCAAVARPEAQMLGAVQERWLLEGLGQATWQVLAQQVMLMRREFPRGAISMDKWDAAPAARARLLQGLRDRGVANAVVLSGDVHNAWAGTLRLDPLDEASPAVATEFTGTSITSEGDGSEVLASTPEVLRRNPHIAHFHNRRGYTLHEATPARMEVTFRAVPYVMRPDAPREDRGRFVVEAGRPGVTPG